MEGTTLDITNELATGAIDIGCSPQQALDAVPIKGVHSNVMFDILN